jgi:ParB family transcriptional regulator, chromosome partitioning protein
MTRPSGLGRGLGALLPAAAPGRSGMQTLLISAIRPNPKQPREYFDEETLDELARSITEVGILQPILVRPVDQEEGRYEIVAGERRFRAARMAGLDEVPAIIRHTQDSQLLTEALVENIHRADLNPIEEAAAYQQLLDDFGMTHEELAQRLGKSRSAISNALRLLALPEELMRLVAEGPLSAGHARALLALDSAAQQEKTGTRVVAEGLSVRATEELVRRLLAGGDRDTALANLAKAAKARHASPYQGLQRRLSDTLNTKVQIKGTARRGRVVIDYAGSADLERLLDILSRGTGENLLAE